ncbi:hypothetical protein [Nesterenkonia ebinurensis]|uniref:hypothetical protein n=1 Tax=Nesterenkonia ebinurensis TaxID=2608252 RepID=UPI00123CB9AB|nr:hypothetical protein [Nesterenkonia ebinurensis]
MRNLLSVLCLLLAGLLSFGGLAGYQLNQLLRSEEPVREIAGTLPQQPEFSQAVTEMLIEDLANRLPEELQWAVPGGIDQMLNPILAQAFNNERTLAAWDDVLQQTRSGYTAQLEEIFAAGSSGDTSELDIELELTPIAEAMTAPLREGLADIAGWVPGINLETFDFIAPEIEIDIQAAADSEADPYTWASIAAFSRWWLFYGIGAAVLAVAGLLIGTGRTRWYALAGAAVLAAGLGLWIVTGIASPDLQHPPGVPEAGAVILDHVQTRFTSWAQPPWWVFSGIAGGVVLIGMAGALLTPSRRR